MARKAEFDRDAVLGRAMDLFWTQGYHATSLKDLEQALDMRPGSIYAAFGSKAALFEAALTLYSTRAQAALAATLAGAATPLEGLATHVRNLAAHMLGAVPSRACFLVKTVLETSANDPELNAQAEAMLRQTEAAFAQAFRAAQAAGQIGPERDVARMASRLQAEIFGLRAYAQRLGAEARVRNLAEDIAQGLERGAV